MERLIEAILLAPFVIAILVIMGYHVRGAVPLAETAIRARLVGAAAIVWMGFSLLSATGLGIALWREETSLLDLACGILLAASVIAAFLLFVYWLFHDPMASGRHVTPAQEMSESHRPNELERSVRTMAERMGVGDRLQIAYSFGSTPWAYETFSRRRHLVLPHAFRHFRMLEDNWPKSLGKAFLRLVIAHELAHFRNGDARFTVSSIILRQAIWGWLRLHTMVSTFALLACLASGSPVSSALTVAWLITFFPTLFGVLLLDLASRYTEEERQFSADLVAFQFLDSETRRVLDTNVECLEDCSSGMLSLAQFCQAEPGPASARTPKGRLWMKAGDTLVRWLLHSPARWRTLPQFTELLAHMLMTGKLGMQARMDALRTRKITLEELALPSVSASIIWGSVCSLTAFAMMLAFAVFETTGAHNTQIIRSTLTQLVLVIYPLLLFVLPVLRTAKPVLAHGEHLNGLITRIAAYFIAGLLTHLIAGAAPLALADLVGDINRDKAITNILMNHSMVAVIVLMSTSVMLWIRSRDLSPSLKETLSDIAVALLVMWPFVLFVAITIKLCPGQHAFANAVWLLVAVMCLGGMLPQRLNPFSHALVPFFDLNSLNILALKLGPQAWRWDISRWHWATRITVSCVFAGAGITMVLLLPGSILLALLHSVTGMLDWPFEDAFVSIFGLLLIAAACVAIRQLLKRKSLSKAHDSIEEMFLWVRLLAAMCPQNKSAFSAFRRLWLRIQPVHRGQFDRDDRTAWKDDALNHAIRQIEVDRLLDAEADLRHLHAFVRACQGEDGGIGRWPGAHPDWKSAASVLKAYPMPEEVPFDRAALRNWTACSLTTFPRSLTLEEGRWILETCTALGVPVPSETVERFERMLPTTQLDNSESDYGNAESSIFILTAQGKLEGEAICRWQAWLQRQLGKCLLAKPGHILHELNSHVDTAELLNCESLLRDPNLVEMAAKGAFQFCEDISETLPERSTRAE